MPLRTLCIACLVLSGVGTVRADEKALRAEMKKFEGTWEFTESLLNGETRPEGEIKSYRLVIKGDTFENQRDGKVTARGTWKFVAQKGAVLHIDVTPADGPDQGKPLSAIFEWVGDAGARFCGPAAAGGDRPTKFAGGAGSKQLLIVYKRVKP
jgi:uncharacterized protein (TIGR03067 family)